LNINDLSELAKLIYGLSQENWNQVRDQVRGQEDREIWQVFQPLIFYWILPVLDRAGMGY